MTQEQKARKFEDFLDKMRGLLDEANRQGHIIIRVEDLEHTFPELKESDDERIRKALIEFFESQDDNTTYSLVPKKDILAWLEKQGTSYTKRDVDDAYIEGVSFAKDELEKQGEQILANSAKTCKDEHKPAWSEDYTERMGQIINYLTCQAKEEPTRKRTLLGWVALLKSIFKKGLPEIQIPCTEAARKGIHRIMDVLEWAADKGRISDSDCEDYMILLSAYLPQPKIEWSEEDEERLQSCLNILQVQAKCFMGITETINTKWLKSLKQRYTWKPSDEQMKLLKELVEDNNQRHFYALLKSLYVQLKTLKGE